MRYAELTLVVPDNRTVRAERDDGAQTSGELMLDTLHFNLISLFEDWLSQEKQEGQNRKMSHRREFEVFGALLYRTLFDRQIGAFFERALSEVRDGGRLRVRLSFQGEAADLASIPWEYLYYPDTDYRRGFFLATHMDLILSRYMPLEIARQNLAPAEGPLRILIVVSKPQDLDPVISDGVIEPIQNLVRTDSAKVEILNKPTLDSFLDKLDETKPHVLHFISHGQFNKAEGKGEIALLDANEASARWIGDRDFAEFFVHMHSIPKLVFLHLCESGAIDFTANFAGLAPQLVRAGVQAVVAMQYPITNNAAIIFSRAFYRELAKGEHVDAAVQEGRYRITTNDSKAYDSRVFGTPVLYMRSRDGVIRPPQ